MPCLVKPGCPSCRAQEAERWGDPAVQVDRKTAGLTCSMAEQHDPLAFFLSLPCFIQWKSGYFRGVLYCLRLEILGQGESGKF